MTFKLHNIAPAWLLTLSCALYTGQQLAMLTSTILEKDQSNSSLALPIGNPDTRQHTPQEGHNLHPIFRHTETAPKIHTPLIAENKNSPPPIPAQLLGIIADKNGPSIAIVQFSGQQQLLVNGQEIEEMGHKLLLKKISNEAVRIRIDNNEYQLRLTTKATVQTIAPPPTQDTDLANRAIDLNSPKFQQYIQNPKETIKRNPSTLARFFSIAPFLRSGEMVGYILTQPQEAGLMDALQIQQGDILQSVGGTPVTLLSSADIARLTTQQTPVQITLLRGNEIITRDFKF